MSGILQEFISGGAQTPKCANVVISPNSGTVALTVSLSTTTVGAHIFVVKNVDVPLDPQHSGDSAIAPTIRIGSNSGSINTGGAISGSSVIIRALAYSPFYLDSDITEGSYDGRGGNGGGG